MLTENDLMTWRRHLHQHPELSFQEFETARYIEEQLLAMGLSPVRIAETGVYVDVGPAGGESTVAIRADIDALPLTELTGLPFQSVRKGVMHACGHDGHTAIALGVAKRLVQMRDQLKGCIRVFFQPAEETPPGGALTMIKAGILEGVRTVIGLHLWSPMPSGTAGIAVGSLTANADIFEITVQGKGGHGAMPHHCIDAVMVGSELVSRLQTIVSRQIDPCDPAVITVGALQAGTAHNIIADTAQLLGTVRTHSDQTRDFIEAEMHKVCRAFGELYGAAVTLSYQRGYPAVVNHAEPADAFAKICAKHLGADQLLGVKPLLVGEDFAYYLQERTGAFLLLGVGNPECASVYPHHHPRFTIDEKVLMAGVDILIDTAMLLS